jgi:hypothetical protein
VGGLRTRCLALGCDKNKGQAGQLGYGLLKIGDGEKETWPDVEFSPREQELFKRFNSFQDF